MSTIKKALAVAATLTFALGALAAQAGSRNDGIRKIQLSEPTAFQGTTVPAGSYTLSWIREHGSEAVRIELARGKDVVATGKGIWIASDKPSPYESVVFGKNGEGHRELSEIRFRRSSDSILVGTGLQSADARQEKKVDQPPREKSPDHE